MGHGGQDACPQSLAKRPGAHGAQLVLPSRVVLYRPRGHSRQRELPARALYWPCGQKAQAPLAEEEYEPAGQPRCAAQTQPTKSASHKHSMLARFPRAVVLTLNAPRI